MSLSLKICIISFIILICADVTVVFLLLLNRLKKLQLNNKLNIKKQKIVDTICFDSDAKKAKNYLDRLIKLKSSVILDNYNTKGSFSYKTIIKIESKYIKRLNSVFKTKRMDAAVQLSILASDNARVALEKAIIKEKNVQVKLYMANALSDIGDERSIPYLVRTLIGAHEWYRSRVNMMITEYGAAFSDYLPQISSSKKIEIQELIVDFSEVYISAFLKKYLIDLVDEEIRSQNEKSMDINRTKIAYKAAKIIEKTYPDIFTKDKYIDCFDKEIRSCAIKALAHSDIENNIDRLLLLLKKKDTAREAANAIIEILNDNPDYINKVIDFFNKENAHRTKTYLAEILSIKIDYFLMQLLTNEKKVAEDIIKQIILLGKTSNIINFLNENKNKDLENEILAIIKSTIKKDDSLEIQFCSYLNPRLKEKIKLNEHDYHEDKAKENYKPKRDYYFIIAVSLLICPAIYMFKHCSEIFSEPLIIQLKAYIIDYNYFLIFYSIAINIIYLLLLVFSSLNVRRQAKLWGLKTKEMLFKKRMLPSITVIAPAYNEEKTIIESANSLLNLIYPDYELVIVNDGSEDNTLQLLINTFDLKRVDLNFEYKLLTKPVLGVYKNPSMPNLTVINKENGGKADSLNAGINASTKDFFCGIDADSILEREALLKIASMELDAGIETTALGGNIVPANGCKLDNGEIKEIGISKNKFVAFQTVEYIRAFMAGRLGWAYINSLLIVSGAFGLFRKSKVISVDGYLSRSSKHEKSTVGEDMELVVRLSRVMHEISNKLKIYYAYNANCWTEVPETLVSLKKQRNRWQRGLIEILAYHKKMLFNSNYGRAGMIAMPYYFIFEVIGPLLETQGYLMVIIALIFNMVNVQLAFLLFIATVFIGVFISLASLLIADKNIDQFSLKDLFKLIFYAIIENFGPRQIFSFWRVETLFRMLHQESNWGKSDRRGFNSTKLDENGIVQ